MNPWAQTWMAGSFPGLPVADRRCPGDSRREYYRRLRFERFEDRCLLAGWVELDESASDGGLSLQTGRSTSPAVVVGNWGQPIVAWLERGVSLSQPRPQRRPAESGRLNRSRPVESEPGSSAPRVKVG